MKTTLRSNALIAVSMGLAFSTILFQDIIIAVALLLVVSVLFGEAAWVLIVTSRPRNWFKLSSSVEKNEKKKKSVYSGDSVTDRFQLAKKGSGSVSLSSDSAFLQIAPTMISSKEHSTVIQMNFKTPFAGEYIVRELKLAVLGPLHLFVRGCVIPLSLKYSIRPKVLESAIASAKLLASRKSAIGETPTKIPGIGTEFYDMRNYQLSDDYRQINWKATARMGRLIVNERMKEVFGSHYIVLEARARDYFDRDRLAATFLQLANSLTVLGINFGVLIHDGEKVICLREVSSPEDSLNFALRVAFDFAEVKKADLPEELTVVTSDAMKANEEFASNLGLNLLSEIEKAGRLNLRSYVSQEDPYRKIVSLVGENQPDIPSVLYVSGASGQIDLIVELASELRRRYSTEFVLVNPTMPWIAAADELEAYKLYKRFLGNLRAFQPFQCRICRGRTHGHCEQAVIRDTRAWRQNRMAKKWSRQLVFEAAIIAMLLLMVMVGGTLAGFQIPASWSQALNPNSVQTTHDSIALANYYNTTLSWLGTGSFSNVSFSIETFPFVNIAPSLNYTATTANSQISSMNISIPAALQDFNQSKYFTSIKANGNASALILQGCANASQASHTYSLFVDSTTPSFSNLGVPVELYIRWLRSR